MSVISVAAGADRVYLPHSNQNNVGSSLVRKRNEKRKRHLKSGQDRHVQKSAQGAIGSNRIELNGSSCLSLREITQNPSPAAKLRRIPLSSLAIELNLDDESFSRTPKRARYGPSYFKGSSISGLSSNQSQFSNEMTTSCLLNQAFSQASDSDSNPQTYQTFEEILYSIKIHALPSYEVIRTREERAIFELDRIFEALEDELMLNYLRSKYPDFELKTAKDKVSLVAWHLTPGKFEHLDGVILVRTYEDLIQLYLRVEDRSLEHFFTVLISTNEGVSRDLKGDLGSADGIREALVQKENKKALSSFAKIISVKINEFKRDSDSEPLYIPIVPPEISLICPNLQTLEIVDMDVFVFSKGIIESFKQLKTLDLSGNYLLVPPEINREGFYLDIDATPAAEGTLGFVDVRRSFSSLSAMVQGPDEHLLALLSGEKKTCNYQE